MEIQKRYYNAAEIVAVTGLARTQLFAAIERKEFPEADIGKAPRQRKLWLKAKIDALLQATSHNE